jgi:hypothetical protein
MVLDCPQPAGWSTAVDAKTGDVREAGHERQRSRLYTVGRFLTGAWPGPKSTVACTAITQCSGNTARGGARSAAWRGHGVSFKLQPFQMAVDTAAIVMVLLAPVDRTKLPLEHAHSQRK